MATHKLSGNQVILGGATILSAPTIYASAFGLTTGSTGTFQIYGVPDIDNTSTDATLGGINLGGMVQYVKKIHMAAAYMNGGTTTLKDTGWDIPYGAIIEDVFVNTITDATCSTNTVSVGVSGDVDGLLVSVDPVGTWKPVLADYGALFRATGTSDLTERVPYYTRASTTRSVTLSRSATTFSATWVAQLFIKYLLPSS